MRASPVALTFPEEDASMDARQAFACAMRGKIRRRRPLEILLAEDDASDAMLAECALDDTCIAYRLHRISGGTDVIAFLRREGMFADAPPPDVILLDLSLPQKDGLAVLMELAKEAIYASIPIIILSGSPEKRNTLPKDALWLSDYLPKPCSGLQLQEAFGKLHSPASAA